MNRNVSIAAALVIVIISAVLFVTGSRPEKSSSSDSIHGAVVRTDSLSGPPAVAVPEVPVISVGDFGDSVVALGSTGYAVTLPPAYTLRSDNDRTFQIFPVKRDTGCGQNLRLSFTSSLPKIPGIRPQGRPTYTILGQPVKCIDWPGSPPYCRQRAVSLSLDSAGYLDIFCYGPADDRMEQLFAVVLSLKKIRN